VIEESWDEYFHARELEVRVIHLEEMIEKIVTLIDTMNDQINSVSFIGMQDKNSYYQPRNRRQS